MSTPRIRLRALEPGDLDIVVRWENDPKNWPVTSTYIPFSRHLLKEYVEAEKDIYRDKQFRFVIELTENNAAVGFIDLFDVDAVHQRAGVGILIGEYGERGKGYAHEALMELIQHCRSILLLRSIYCNILCENTASVQLFERCGFKINGKKENWFRTSSGWSDEYFLQLEL
ncbi:MAG TPA: GNAT family N-acetyltransferase [Flavobacteriales bacterium]|nr:GNAT family N-acetyltransferase [Flavobacteriales bacterium]HRE74283.1 GNAT family N-acetyltransferase [Flavobacteriales bacterium]HRE97024.1 GNAT family N-acetyltransferase [Flavobacteriales bacterium]HRJ37033.1 GNAT family N-acetyltransferase [Flavobacteriales bacterium]HRJ39127.1 GNAT family N-acetyltransferase [Flavobacteriales bacterium]